jgi:hypothetical protein
MSFGLVVLPLSLIGISVGVLIGAPALFYFALYAALVTIPVAQVHHTDESAFHFIYISNKIMNIYRLIRKMKWKQISFDNLTVRKWRPTMLYHKCQKSEDSS